MAPSASKVSSLFSVSAQEARTCPTHGEYIADMIRLGGRESWTGCVQCDIDRKDREGAESRKAFDRQRQIELVERIIADAGIQPRFADAVFENYKTDQPNQARALAAVRDYAQKFPTYRANGTCLILCGNVGNGKTHLASALIQHIAKAHQMTSRMIKLDEILGEIKATFRESARGCESEIYRSMTKRDLLVIDEVGIQTGSDFERRAIFRIIDARYDQGLPTVLISNLPLQRIEVDGKKIPSIEDCIGERVMDRLRENGGKVVVFNWKSARG